MKFKYVPISGLAFTEEKDLLKLKRLAAQGWILERIVGSLFYKLRKSNPQDIDYSLDYQTNPDEDYVEYFKHVGWQHVCSYADSIHIFSAPAGTPPIYTDHPSLVEKYQRQKRETGVGTLATLASSVLLGILQFVTNDIPYLGVITLILFMISVVMFVFFVMPFIAYTYRVGRLQR